MSKSDRIYVFAGNRGAPTNPSWYHNLVAPPDGTLLCPRGLRMHPTYQFQHTKGYRTQRYHCPLLFPEPTGQTCDHEQFLKEKGCVKDINQEAGGLMRVTLDRESPLYPRDAQRAF